MQERRLGDPRVLQGWDNFYYLIGSASAGLIGLLFVVMTLTAGRERSKILRGAALYMTPTIVHFGVVLSISAITMAPGLPPAVRGAAFALFAVAGLAASLRGCVGLAGLRRAPGSPAHWSDFWCYGLAPAVMYLGLAAVIAEAFWARSSWAPYAMAGLLLALLLLAIRNAWDLVTWMTPGPPAAGEGGRSAAGVMADSSPPGIADRQDQVRRNHGADHQAPERVR